MFMSKSVRLIDIMASDRLVRTDVVNDVYKLSIVYSQELSQLNQKLNRKNPTNTYSDHTFHTHDKRPSHSTFCSSWTSCTTI
jgi:hypothetical protein